MEFKGLAINLMFYKRLLDKIGVQAEIFRPTGNKYKSAVEPYFLEKASDANRIQLKALIDDFWDEMLDKFSKKTGLSADELNNIAKKRKWLHELDKDLLMKPTNDDNECMFVDKTDKAEYIRAEDHKIVLDKLKKFEQSNNDMKNDLTDMMKYINQLEKYVYKMESIDDEESNEEDVDEASNETDVDTDETDVDVDETEVQSKDIDFIEIGNNVYLNKKTNKTYEIAPDDDLDDDEDLF